MRRRFFIPGALALVLATGCSASLGPDQAGVEFNGGAIQSKNFDNCVKPGDREYHGPGDTIYVYPAGQRSYEFSDNTASRETKMLSVVSRDLLPMDVAGVATFSLNTDCKTLQQFHERIGIKYEAWTDTGWLDLLGTYLQQPLDRTMDEVAKQYTWKELYSNPAVKDKWETQVGEKVVTQVNTVAGGQFFCSPSYTGNGKCGAFSLTLQQPQPPLPVRNALAATQEAAEQAATQRNQNLRVQTELESLRDLVKVLGRREAILYKAIQDGKIKVIPLPSGGSLNVSGD
jgi:hypothetical protein